MMLALLIAACRFAGPDADTVDTSEASSVAPPDRDVNYVIEAVAGGALPGQTGVRSAFTNPLNGATYALDSDGLTFRYLLDTWVYPTGDYCVGGTVDENGVCRGGITWTSGRIISPAPTLNHCLDRENGLLYLLKAGGDTIEVIDVSMEGADPYTYERAIRNARLPLDIADAVNWTGPCEVDNRDDSILLTSAPQMGLVRLSNGASFTTVKTLALGFAPAAVVRQGDRILLADQTGNRLLALDNESYRPLAAWQAPAPILDAAFSRTTGTGWAALGESGVASVELGDNGAARGWVAEVQGSATAVVADPGRGVAWALVHDDNGDSVALVQPGEVRESWPIPGTGLRLSEPSATGDVAVFYTPEGSAEVAFTVLAPREDVQVLDPLNIFLFTTIEEPSDANMGLDCDGPGTTFATELTLVRNNSAVLASLGVPVAMAITDNFAQKAEECGQTAIYQELADLGFELGAMLHNRPCYNCSNGGDSNPDHCNADSAYYISSGSGAACFPGDPEYCDLGDYDCYLEFLAPRVDIADRYIPGGARFIVGADRHGMWSYDWVRLYREVDRPSQGKTGFDLTLFAGAWAFNDVAYDDPRGKNPAPWHVDKRTAAWHLGDINAWDQDSPTSNLLYLSGANSATVKLAEQQQSGLYMLDFFEVATQVAYRPDDFEMQYQWLRSAVQNRKPGATNTWYFHIHDTGTVNVRGTDNTPIEVDKEDPDAPTVEESLADFITRINDRYDGTGAVEWKLPSEIRALEPRR
jgi:hypothetical protein